MWIERAGRKATPPVPPNIQKGEFKVRAPCVSSFYYDSPRDRWFRNSLSRFETTGSVVET